MSKTVVNKGKGSCPCGKWVSFTLRPLYPGEGASGAHG